MKLLASILAVSHAALATSSAETTALVLDPTTDPATNITLTAPTFPPGWKPDPAKCPAYYRYYVSGCLLGQANKYDIRMEGCLFVNAEVEIPTCENFDDPYYCGWFHKCAGMFGADKNYDRCSWLRDLVKLCMKCDSSNLMCEIIPGSDDYASSDDETPPAMVGLIRGSMN